MGQRQWRRRTQINGGPKEVQNLMILIAWAVVDLAYHLYSGRHPNDSATPVLRPGPRWLFAPYFRGLGRHRRWQDLGKINDRLDRKTFRTEAQLYIGHIRICQVLFSDF
jgi:hypothetical protein